MLEKHYRLSKNSKDKEKEWGQEGKLITKKKILTFDEGMIFRTMREIAGQIYNIPNLLVVPDMVSAHGNESGAFCGVDVDVKARDGMDNQGGGVYAEAVRKSKSQKLDEKVRTERQSAGLPPLEDDLEEDNPTLHLTPNLNVEVEKGDMKVNKGHYKSDGKANIQTKEGGDIDSAATSYEAEDDIKIDAFGSNRHYSTTSRVHYGQENHYDLANQAFIKSHRGHVDIKSGLHTFFKGLNTYSKKGTTFSGNGSWVDETLALSSQVVTRDGKNWTRDTYTFKQGSRHVSDGDITATYQGRVDVVAPNFVVPKDREVVIIGFGGVKAHQDHNTHEHASHTEKKGRGWFGRSSSSDFQSFSASSIGMTVTGGKARIVSGYDDLILENVHFSVDKTTLTVIDDACKVLIAPGTNYFSSAFSGKSADMFWQTMKARTVQSQTYSDSQFDGELEIEAREAIITQVCGRTLAFMDRIQIKDGKISLEYVHELYESKEFSQSGPTAALSAVIAIAAAMAAVVSGGTSLAASAAVSATGVAAGGTAATIIGAMAGAGFGALCAQTALALAHNGMDPIKAAKALAHKDSIKSIAIAMAAAGLVAGVSQALGAAGTSADATARATDQASKAAAVSNPPPVSSLPQVPPVPTFAQSMAESLKQHAQSGLVNHFSNAAVDMAFNGRSFETAIKTGVLNSVINVLAASVTNQVAFGVKTGFLNKFGQFMCHLGIGAGIGASVEGTKGIANGMMFAAIAEGIGQAVKDDPEATAAKATENVRRQGLEETHENVSAAIQDELKKVVEIGKFGTAVAAILLKRDVDLAARVATNALEHNFSKEELYACLKAYADACTDACSKSLLDLKDGLMEMTCEQLDSLADILERDQVIIGMSLQVFAESLEITKQDRGTARVPVKGPGAKQAKKLVAKGLESWAKKAPQFLKETVKNIRASKTPRVPHSGLPGASAPIPAPSAPKSAVNPQGVAPTAKKEVSFGEQGAGVSGVNPLEQKLDFSRYSPGTKGDSAHHLKVQHGQLRLDKKDQGVFYGEPTQVTQEAWNIARQQNIQPINCGYSDVYVVPRPNAGYVGGPGGQRGGLDYVTIRVEAGTNKLITAHPSGKTIDFPDGHIPFSVMD